MIKLVCVVVGALFGMIAAGAVTSHVYKLGLMNDRPALKCELVKQTNFVAGTFESEVKRTE